MKIDDNVGLDFWENAKTLAVWILTIFVVMTTLKAWNANMPEIKTYNTVELYKQCQAAGGTLVETVCYGNVIQLKLP